MFEKPICRQAEWTDILSFFLLNIAVHAATVPPSPGSAFFGTAEHIIWSLFTPYYSAVRAVRIISHASIWASTPLQRALRAEALCVVARTKDWKTNEGTTRSLAELRSIYGAYSYPCLDLWWDGKSLKDMNTNSTPTWLILALGDNLYNQPHQCQRSIHGKIYIPPESGYAISQLPDRSVKVEEHLPDKSTNFELPCNHSVLKPLLDYFWLNNSVPKQGGSTHQVWLWSTQPYCYSLRSHVCRKSYSSLMLSGIPKSFFGGIGNHG